MKIKTKSNGAYPTGRKFWEIKYQMENKAMFFNLQVPDLLEFGDGSFTIENLHIKWKDRLVCLR